jgi:hypothetical protein
MAPLVKKGFGAPFELILIVVLISWLLIDSLLRLELQRADGSTFRWYRRVRSRHATG